ncbi:MAG: glycosyltransferase [Sumerlaeia bacterium]
MTTSENSTPPAFDWRGRNVVCFSTADWDTLLPTNKHHLMRRLAARGARVLFLETLGTRAPRLASGVDLARIGRRLGRAAKGPQKRENRLYSLSPLVRPRWANPVDRALNRAAFLAQAGPSLRRMPDAIAWIYSPYAIYLLDQVKPAKVVYHMVDDLTAVPGADRDAMAEAERALLRRADCVFCTERSLHARALRENPRALYMPNVADFAHFSEPRTMSPNDERLRRLREMDGPKLVFSGHITPHKTDLELLEVLARERPAWHFVLIGPVWEGAERPAALQALEGLPNVQFFGHVDYADLPAYLHEAGVLMIPYSDTPATRAVFPLKFFEYLATGRPVVVSPLPSLSEYAALVPMAHAPTAWLETLERVLSEPGEGAPQRIALACENTWDTRLLQMERALTQIS